MIRLWGMRSRKETMSLRSWDKQPMRIESKDPMRTNKEQMKDQ